MTILPTLSLETVERLHIQKVLDHCRWNRTQASALLGISTKTLYRKIKLFSLTPAPTADAVPASHSHFDADRS